MVAPSSRIAEIPEAELSSAQTEVLRKLMAERGRVPTPFKIWLHSPALADRLHDLGSLLTGETTLSKREAKIAILLIAAHWRAIHVFTMHAREAREAGLPDAVIDAISAGDDWTYVRDHANVPFTKSSSASRASGQCPTPSSTRPSRLWAIRGWRTCWRCADTSRRWRWP